MIKSPQNALPDNIFSFGTVCQAGENTVLIDYGQPVTHMSVIIEGTVKVCKRSKSNDDLFLYYLSAREACIFSYTCWLNKSASPFRAVAETEVKYLIVPCLKIETLIQYDTSWNNFILKNYSAKFLEIVTQLEMTSDLKLDERLYTFLINKSRITRKSILIVSHQQLAEDLRTSRVVISRVLKTLELKGKLIMHRNEIHMRL